MLDIFIHRHLLFTFFEDGISSMKEGENQENDAPQPSNISKCLKVLGLLQLYCLKPQISIG